MTIKTKMCFIVWLILLIPMTASADFSITIDNDEYLIIGLVNEVTMKDAMVVSQEVNEFRKRHRNESGLMISLNSTGGNISAALKIGRILRQNNAIGLVDTKSVCLSSCVYILAGAVSRIVFGKVGIHRPYEPDGNTFSESAQKAKYKKLGAEIRGYLEKMNILVKLYDDSMYISPESIKILTSDEMQIYGLNSNDPYYEEAAATKKAKSLGISRKEYAARLAEINQKCGGVDMVKCYESIMKGKNK